MFVSGTECSPATRHKFYSDFNEFTGFVTAAFKV